MNIAVIPARGGSKRIPKKNIRKINGKPLIGITIENIIKSKIFDKVIISSDDTKIIKIAENYGVEAPFLRPKNLSNDFADTLDVMHHASSFLKKKYSLHNTSCICCIYPTAIFTTPEMLRKAYNSYLNSTYTYVFYAIKFRKNIHRSFKLSDGKIKMNFPQFFKERSQDLPYSYYDSGQFYFSNAKNWIDKKKIFSKNSFFLEIEEDKIVDIDDMNDLKIAKKFFKKRS